LAPDLPADRRLSYQPALDGIRALAVAAILAFHGQLSWARGGFLGVDAFFVLSGYLITSLLIEEWRRTGHIDLPAFWARRARRLLPALYLLLLAMAGYAVVFARAEELKDLRGDALSALAGISNWWPFIVDRDYSTPLRHIWSLSIEQQWYLVWPPVFLLLIRARSSPLRLLFAATVLLALASVLLSAWLYEPETVPRRVYFGTDTRAQSLLVGAALAALLVQYGPIRGVRAGRALQILGILCAAAVAWAWMRTPVHHEFLYQGGYLLFALAVAFVIAAVVQSEAGVLSRLFASAPLRGLGLISYGVYLWHVPVYWVLTSERTTLDGYALFVARVYLSLMLAIISYNLIETPFRRGVLRRWRASWSLAPAGAMGVGAVVLLVTQIRV
jgi:peptidoglycan/LPS O-acetylase OafA/YrhL